MSIYNAIANSGRNAGAGINAFAQGRYNVQQDRQRNTMIQEDRQYQRSRNALADERYDTEQAEARKQQAMQEAIQMAQGGAPDETILGHLSRVGKELDLPEVDPAVLQEIRARAQSGSGSKVYGTPIYGLDEEGNTAVGQLTQDGRLIRSQGPEGFTPTSPVQFQNLGDRVVGVDPRNPGAPPAADMQMGLPPSSDPANKPPTGYRYVKDASGQVLEAVPIPGSPADREIKEIQKKLDDRKESTALAGGTVVQDLERGLDVIQTSASAAGPQSVAFRHVPGTPSYMLDQFVQSAASNIGIDRLQAMRESSPTGGALGQVPFQQQKRLEQLLGSLDISQREDVLIDNMKRIQNIYLDIIHGPGNGPQRKRLSFDSSGKRVPGGAPWRPEFGDEEGAAGPKIGTVEDGYIYTGGDPGSPSSWKKQ